MDLIWKGKRADGFEATGRIKIPEFMHDTEIDEIVYDVIVDSETREKELFKPIIRANLLPLISEKFSKFNRDLIEANKGDVVYTADAENKPITTDTKYQPKPPAPVLSNVAKNNVIGAVATVTMEVELVASAADVYDTLLNKDKVQIWSRGKAFVSEAPGSEFSLFDGNIVGFIDETEKNRLIVMRWRVKSWAIGHFSKVTLTFNDNGSATIVKLNQTDVPIGEKEITKNNWSQYYWNPIKGAFGFGSLLQR